jgi:hypothetical protein
MTLKQAIEEADRVRVPVRIERGFTYHAIITKRQAKVIASDYLEEKFVPLSKFWLIKEIARFEIVPGTGTKILYLGK